MRVMEDGGNETSKRKAGNIFDILLLVVAVLGVVYFIYSKMTGFVIGKNIELAFLIIFILLEGLYIFKPFGVYKETRFLINIREMSIRAKVILGFLMVSVLCVLLIGVTTYFPLRTNFETPKKLWEYIYIIVGFSMNALFIVSILFLRYVEKKITNPIELLAEQAMDFARRDHQKDSEEEQKFLLEKRNQIKKPRFRQICFRVYFRRFRNEGSLTFMPL